MNLQSVLIILLLLLSSLQAHAAQYECMVDKKFNFETTYTSDEINKAQFSVKINENAEMSSLSRCSYSIPESKVTCDDYPVDKISLDRKINTKKYYVFRSQFDVQIFPDLRFIENNGRGGIAYGKCRLVSP